MGTQVAERGTNSPAADRLRRSIAQRLPPTMRKAVMALVEAALDEARIRGTGDALAMFEAGIAARKRKAKGQFKP